MGTLVRNSLKMTYICTIAFGKLMYAISLSIRWISVRGEKRHTMIFVFFVVLNIKWGLAGRGGSGGAAWLYLRYYFYCTPDENDCLYRGLLLHSATRAESEQGREPFQKLNSYYIPVHSPSHMFLRRLLWVHKSLVNCITGCRDF